jgi:glucosyl-dolichyl phosphate glucuronosyltransferase
MTDVVIAIPTHNRASKLRETLRSVFALRIPPDARLECVLIDNGSTDNTADVFADESRSAPFPARRVFEPRLGESAARNRAIYECAGEFLLFIDDDAIAEPDWASAMVAALRERKLDAACGMVIAQWPYDPPQWLGPRLYPKLAVHDPNEIESASPEAVENLSNYFGANMGFRRDTFDRFGRFREDLGVTGSSAISGADTDFFLRMISNGGRMGFVPGAVVHHQIGPERMTRAYLLKKSFAYGFGSAVAARRGHNGIDKLIKNLARMAGAAIRGDREGVLYHQMECANFFGYWRGRAARGR